MFVRFAAWDFGNLPLRSGVGKKLVPVLQAAPLASPIFGLAVGHPYMEQHPSGPVYCFVCRLEPGRNTLWHAAAKAKLRALGVWLSVCFGTLIAERGAGCVLGVVMVLLT